MLEVKRVSNRLMVFDTKSEGKFPIAVRVADHVFAPGVFISEAPAYGPGEWSQRLWSNDTYTYAKEVLSALNCPSSGILHLIQYMTDDRTMVTASYPGRQSLFGDELPCTTAIGVSDLATRAGYMQLDIAAYAGSAAVVERTRGADVLLFSESIEVAGDLYFAGVTVGDAAASADLSRWASVPSQDAVEWLFREKLTPRLDAEGCSVNDITVLHCHLKNLAREVAPVVSALKSIFHNELPVLQFSPASQLHWQDGRIEITAMATRSADRDMSSLASKDPSVWGGPRSSRIGDFVHTATCLAGPRCQEQVPMSYYTNPVALETRDILTQIEEICALYERSIADLVRLRIYLKDINNASDVFAAIHDMVGDSVAVSFVGDRSPDSFIDGCSVSADAVFYCP
ncbi:hypothetical protein [Brevibacterium sp. UCMA 11754]|uniref:hypothetical protein n=1 Tax=Brevibacterium sp. UCMA 11754 TaxID=2749198 RepID=UPI001F48F92E|nr:hypothetical protein [Brevibacterium sp. UCMA 11754]MCF2571126.1 hypothetical protein [Brevibacterium sp. UCMA 11754]